MFDIFKKCPFKVGDKVKFKSIIYPAGHLSPWIITKIYSEGGCWVLEDNLGNREVAPKAWSENDFTIEKI